MVSGPECKFVGSLIIITDGIIFYRRHVTIKKRRIYPPGMAADERVGSNTYSFPFCESLGTRK